MDDARYEVRPFRDADYEDVARIDAETNPGFSMSADEMRHFVAATDSEPGHARLQLAVEERGSRHVVGYGDLSHGAFDFHPREMWLEVGVESACRRQGIGSELYLRLERDAVARGVTTLWGAVRDGVADGTRFFQTRGFTELRRGWTSRLEVGSADLSPFPDRARELASGGIRLCTLASEGAEREEVRKALYQLSVLASKDIPRMAEYRHPPLEVFLQFDVDAPGIVTDGYFLAASGQQYVGMTNMSKEPNRKDTLRVGFTGTHPDYRRRGIAAQLKRMAVIYARDHGYRYLVTGNDSLNRPIWAINERLGFRPEVTWIFGKKPLARDPG